MCTSHVHVERMCSLSCAWLTEAGLTHLPGRDPIILAQSATEIPTRLATTLAPMSGHEGSGATWGGELDPDDLPTTQQVLTADDRDGAITGTAPPWPLSRPFPPTTQRPCG